MDGYGLAWTIYAAGALGCSVAGWLLFRRFGREWASFVFVSVLALLLTPYAVDAEKMLMAPAIFSIVFGGITDGFDTVMPVIMVVSGVWLVGLIISLLLQLALRRFSRNSGGQSANVATQRELPEERHPEDELPDDGVPLRAER